LAVIAAVWKIEGEIFFEFLLELVKDTVVFAVAVDEDHGRTLAKGLVKEGNAVNGHKHS
jgi:hypothetical protein